MILKEVKTLKLKITLLTGLHIGSWEENFKIGLFIKPVIKTIDGYPYIPGSSLKWKLRSIYEIKTKKIKEKKWKDNKYWDIYHLTKQDFENEDKEALFICKVFWTVLEEDLENEGKSNVLSKIWPTRAIFRDLYLTEDSKKKLDEHKEKTWYMFENKIETSLARYWFKKWWERVIERVPAGIEFEWEIKLRIFEWDDEEFLIKELKTLLEEDLSADYLWGWGSRGNGQVNITVEVL